MSKERQSSLINRSINWLFYNTYKKISNLIYKQEVKTLLPQQLSFQDCISDPKLARQIGIKVANKACFLLGQIKNLQHINEYDMDRNDNNIYRNDNNVYRNDNNVYRNDNNVYRNDNNVYRNQNNMNRNKNKKAQHKTDEIQHKLQTNKKRIDQKIKQYKEYSMQLTQKPLQLLCPICLQLFSGGITTCCSHTFCFMCLDEAILFNANCPVCRHPIRGDQFHISKTLQNVINLILNRLQIEDIKKYLDKEHEFRNWFRKRRITKQQLFLGMDLDVRDTEFVWCHAKVIQIYPKSLLQPMAKILVHYQGWDAFYDEVISLDSNRIASFKFYTSRIEIPRYFQEVQHFPLHLNIDTSIESFQYNPSEPSQLSSILSIEISSNHLSTNSNLAFNNNQIMRSRTSDDQNSFMIDTHLDSDNYSVDINRIEIYLSQHSHLMLQSFVVTKSMELTYDQLKKLDQQIYKIDAKIQNQNIKIRSRTRGIKSKRILDQSNEQSFDSSNLEVQKQIVADLQNDSTLFNRSLNSLYKFDLSFKQKDIQQLQQQSYLLFNTYLKQQLKDEQKHNISFDYTNNISFGQQINISFGYKHNKSIQQQKNQSFGYKPDQYFQQKNNQSFEQYLKNVNFQFNYKQFTFQQKNRQHQQDEQYKQDEQQQQHEQYRQKEQQEQYRQLYYYKQQQEHQLSDLIQNITFKQQYNSQTDLHQLIKKEFNNQDIQKDFQYQNPQLTQKQLLMQNKSLRILSQDK